MENPAAVPEVNLEECTGCADCVPACPSEALAVVEHKIAVIADAECLACAACEDACPTGAIGWPYEVVFAENLE